MTAVLVETGWLEFQSRQQFSVDWFSVYTGMYGMGWIGRTFGIQEWDATTIARSFHCEFDVRIYGIGMVEDSVYLFFFNYADNISHISFPPRGKYRVLRA